MLNGCFGVSTMKRETLRLWKLPSRIFKVLKGLSIKLVKCERSEKEYHLTEVEGEKNREGSVRTKNGQKEGDPTSFMD